MNIFPKWFNKIPSTLIVLKTGLLIFSVVIVWYWFSPKNTDVGYAPNQPIAFSHKLHAGELALDCRYCHTTVDKASFAAIPSTEICMNCHNLVRRASGQEEDSPEIAKIIQSYQTGKPIEWVKVHTLPDYAYFNHSRHITAGVSCVNCHGRIDKMEVVFQAEPLSMSWCLDCHRDPAANLRPQEFITDLAWKAETPELQRQIGEQILAEKNIISRENCNACHR